MLCMHGKSLQLCLTLCNPIDGSPPGSSIHRILQARVLEWVAISFSKFLIVHPLTRSNKLPQISIFTAFLLIHHSTQLIPASLLCHFVIRLPSLLICVPLWSCIYTYVYIYVCVCICMGLPSGLMVKNLPAGVSLIPESWISPGWGNGNPLQNSCLERPMDKEAWWAIAHEVAKSQTRPSNWAHVYVYIIIHKAQCYLCLHIVFPLFYVLKVHLDVQKKMSSLRTITNNHNIIYSDSLPFV